MWRIWLRKTVSGGDLSSQSTDPLKDIPDLDEESLTRWQESHSFAGAFEQRLAYLLLEALHLPGQRRLGDVQSMRRPSQVLFLRDGDKVGELVETHCSSDISTLLVASLIPKRYWTRDEQIDKPNQ